MYSLGIDLGSSPVKAAVLDTRTSVVVGKGQFPPEELKISAPEYGWAEQNPELWWQSFLNAFHIVIKEARIAAKAFESIGIAYQKHGLFFVDDGQKILTPSIIWCDSHEVEIGSQTYTDLGRRYFHEALLSAPGNFTTSKLGWVRNHEPELFENIINNRIE